MSYNITGVKIKKIELVIPRDFFFELGDINWWTDGGIDIHENNIKLVFDGDGSKIEGKLLPDKKVKVTDFGCSSAYSSGAWVLETICELCKKYKGTLEVVAVWEGGDNIEEISIKNGVSSRKEL